MYQSCEFFRGYPLPLGTSWQDLGINFAIYAKDVESMSLCLFQKGKKIPEKEIPLSRTGNVWHTQGFNLPEETLYAYCPTYSSPHHHHATFLLDPYARGVSSHLHWGQSTDYFPLGRIQTNKLFDWEEDEFPLIPMKDLIIYEMHVRGFTRHPSSEVENPGTFLGIIEKIPYLKELGVNAIELLPIHEFNECEYTKQNPITHQTLYNYWGYSTVNFFSPMERYSTGQAAALNEFKTMVKALHKNGIEVILDVVFNHTAEGPLNAPTISFRGLDPHSYYIVDSKGKYKDFSGCGNTFNSNNPITLELIIEALRFWVADMHVDGFRFDLASVFMRDENGNPVSKSRIVDAITADPVLSSTKLIAEAWDAAGLFQVGSFAPPGTRWCEWNGLYRDDVRIYLKGDSKGKNLFATRLCGSQDLYGKGKTPIASINFVTCHDGFTLADLVAYHHKHNIPNGEENRDGTNDNRSWNCGVEGVTENSKILTLRERQMRNFHLALMISQGIPMLLMGDEYGHTKNGNNNSWCQDNELNWFLWDELEKKNDFYRFYRLMIQFRKTHPQLKKEIYLTDGNIVWHGVKPFVPEWNNDNKFIAFTLEGIFVAFNASGHDMPLTFPPPPEGKKWHWIVATHYMSPNDIFEVDKAPPAGESTVLPPHSAMLLEAFA